MEEMGLWTRALDKIFRVCRMIADLDRGHKITVQCLSVLIHGRTLDRNHWAYALRFFTVGTDEVATYRDRAVLSGPLNRPTSLNCSVSTAFFAGCLARVHRIRLDTAKFRGGQSFP